MEEFTYVKPFGKDIKIDNYIALKKWGPILNALNISERILTKQVFSDIDPYGEENWDDDSKFNPFRLFAAVYAEYHSLLENKVYTNGEITEENFSNNYLPMSMKILSKLNTKDKNYEIGSGLPVHRVNTKMTREQYADMRDAGLSVVEHVESTFINILTEEINKQLETKNTIKIESLVDSISFSLDDKMNPVITLNSKYEIT